MALESGTSLGPYEILGPLGAGGMGEVYEARDSRLDRLVAVKVLPAGTASPMALERFEREAKTIAALNHPGICAVYDVGTSPMPYLVMELLDGETLHQRLVRGPVDVPTLIDTSLALADALAAAHGKGVVHRDLKPANIFLTAHGPKILDFGLARVAAGVAPPDIGASARPTLAAQAPLTDAGVTVGTVAYMSPEQLRAEELDARSDLFSTGLVLYEMATGHRAFTGATSAVVSAAILHESPPAPRTLRPDLPPRLEQAILTAIEKDREVRTQSASELRVELTRIKRELSGSRAPGAATSATGTATVAAASAASASVVTPPAPSSSDAELVAGLVRRHGGAVAAAVIVALVVLGTLYVVSGPGNGGTATGAPARSITNLTVDQLTTSGTANWPAISPDGNYVAYLEGIGLSLRVRQVITGSNVEIVPAEPGVSLRAPTVSPDGGFVLYLRATVGQPQELWQVPFLGGVPRRLIRGLRTTVGYSPDGSRMAFGRETDQGQEIVLTAADGTDARVLVVRRPPDEFFWVGDELLGSSFRPAWSPDGTTLAVLGQSRDSGQLVFIDVATGAERAVDVGAPLVGTNAWWLDGRTLLLSAIQRPSEPMQLWLASYPDGELSRLSNDLNNYMTVSLTADRNALVTSRMETLFTISTSDAGAAEWTDVVPATPMKAPIGFGIAWAGDDLLYVPAVTGGFALARWRASSGATEVVARDGGWPSVSRDGSTVVFQDFESFAWIADADARDRVELGEVPGRVFVTPDGRHVIMRDDTATPPALVLRPTDGTGGARVVTTDRVAGGPNSGGQVSPNGQWIAYRSTDDEGRAVLAVCDLAACSSRRTLPALQGWHWMPDSSALAYNTGGNLWVQPLDGRAPTQLTRFPDDGQFLWDFAWSADGERLAVARGTASTDIVLFRGLNPPVP